MWWNCLKSHVSSFLLILAIDSRSDHGRWFPNEKSIKERLGSFAQTHKGRALKLSWDSRAGFVKNSQKCFSCREGSLGKGDGLILVPRISKRQRRDARAIAAKRAVVAQRRHSFCYAGATQSLPGQRWATGDPQGLRRVPQRQRRVCVTHSGVT